MTELEKIEQMIEIGEIKNYEPSLKPIFLANCEYFRARNGQSEIFKKIQRKKSGDPIYLSLPCNHIKDYQEEALKNNVVIGCNGMLSVSEGEYTHDIALKVLMETGAKFVLLDTNKESLNEIEKKACQAIIEGIMAFVIIGESFLEFSQGKIFDVLTERIKSVCDQLPEDKLASVSFIYAPSWVTMRGKEGVRTLAKCSYNLFRHVMGTVLGTHASKIRVMLEVPYIVGNCSSYLKESNYEGFYFPGLLVRKSSFLRTCLNSSIDQEHLLNRF